jgi:hypothetical protein
LQNSYLIMKKITSTKLSKRLAQYGALTVAIAGVSDATGQIQYTDVDPDETITGATYNLDLDGDGTVDYVIHNDGGGASAVRVYTDNSSSILGSNAGGNYNYPYAISSGEPIDDGQAQWITAPVYQTLNWQGCAYTNSNWCDGQVDKYLGLRITVGGGTHFGWVRLDVPAAGTSFTVKDYALELTPDTSIEAGDDGVLGTDDQNFNGFVQFVSDNQLNLRANNAMSSAAVYDITGKQVITQNLSTTNAQVNLAGLNTGVYIARVTIDGAEKTFKFVK